MLVFDKCSTAEWVSQLLFSVCLTFIVMIYCHFNKKINPSYTGKNKIVPNRLNPAKKAWPVKAGIHSQHTFPPQLLAPKGTRALLVFWFLPVTCFLANQALSENSNKLEEAQYSGCRAPCSVSREAGGCQEAQERAAGYKLQVEVEVRAQTAPRWGLFIQG